MKNIDFDKELKNKIISLCSVMSVSGFETRETEMLDKLLSDGFDESYTDAVGNHVYIKRCAKKDAPLAVVDAHFDEIGMMVTEVCEDGFLRIAPIGGLSLPVLQGADVIVYGKKTVRGVITSTPPHLRGAKSETLTDIEDLSVDTGYTQEEMKDIAPVGTPIGFAPCYSEMLNGTLAGKSFDNKACAAIAAFAIANTERDALFADVALVLSAYEETSRLGGVAPVVFELAPDYAMVIDVNLATVPDVPKYETVPLGKGISLSVSAATDRALTRRTKDLCDENEIPYVMIAAPSSTGTNAPTVNLVGAGIPVVDVGLPLRCMHTYNEVISMDDARSLCKLVESFICSKKIAEDFCKSGREELPL